MSESISCFVGSRLWRYIRPPPVSPANVLGLFVFRPDVVRPTFSASHAGNGFESGKKTSARSWAQPHDERDGMEKWITKLHQRWAQFQARQAERRRQSQLMAQWRNQTRRDNFQLFLLGLALEALRQNLEARPPMASRAKTALCRTVPRPLKQIVKRLGSIRLLNALAIALRPFLLHCQRVALHLWALCRPWLIPAWRWTLVQALCWMMWAIRLFLGLLRWSHRQSYKVSYYWKTRKKCMFRANSKPPTFPPKCGTPLCLTADGQILPSRV